MREIKFRAWDGKGKMYYPTVFEFGVCGVNGLPSIAVPLDGGGYCTTAYIMQYTGLHDKNGKEIWEGDIVSMEFWNPITKTYELPSHYRHVVIEWSNDRFTGTNHKGLVRTMDTIRIRGAVIGNIYENPELLGGAA